MAAPHRSHVHGLPTHAAAKASLRAERLAARDPAPASADATIARHIARIASACGAARVAAVWPMRGEPDLRAFMSRHARDGGTVLLPRIVARDRALVFDRWREERGVRPGMLGTQVADSAPEEQDLAPELILVPLLAFDVACRRLGRGGGLYDRTLARHASVPAIGVAYAGCERPLVPTEPHDRALDAVVTERGTIRAAGCRIPPA